MAALCDSGVVREVTEALCNGCKSLEIQNLRHKCITLLQDEIAASTHHSNPELEVCQFSMLQLPESHKWRTENRKPVKYV